MGGKRSVVDGTIFYWKNTEGLYGIMCTHVDDLCFRGAAQFHHLVVSWLMGKLKVEMEESNHFRYFGMDIMEGEDNKITMKKLRILLSSGEQRRYRSVLG